MRSSLRLPTLIRMRVVETTFASCERSITPDKVTVEMRVAAGGLWP